MKKWILSLCVAFVPLLVAGQTLTLRQCIEKGIDNNLQLRNARIGISKGTTTVSQNRARLLPVVNGLAQLTDYLVNPVNITTAVRANGKFPDDPSWNKVKGMQYNAAMGVAVSMPLYNKTLHAAIEASKVVEEMSRLSYDKAVEELTTQIAKTYLLAQTAKEEIRLTDENIARMRELCNITEALYTHGVVMEVDLNRVRINIKNLETRKDQYETLFGQNLNLLRFLMDMSPDEKIDVTPLSEYITPMETGSVDACLPELRLAERQQELIDRQMKVVKAGYLPTLSVSAFGGSIDYQEKFGHFFYSHDSHANWFGDAYFALNLRVPIFDAKEKKLKIRQYQYDAAQAANNALLLRQQLNKDYANSSLQLDHNKQMFLTQKDNYMQAQSVYDVTETQYKEGVASMTSLLQDDMQLRTAQQACVEAHCQYELARVDLLRLSGRLALLYR